MVRQGFVVGYATKRTSFAGVIEMNHVGAAADDCFESPTSPDVQPTDTIRTTIPGPGGATDTSMVRGVWIEDMEFGDTTITVSGRVALKETAAINPGTDVLELRINKETDWDLTGGSDLREDIGENVDPDGAWEHVLTVSESDAAEAANPANRETFLEWSDGTAVTP